MPSHENIDNVLKISLPVRAGEDCRLFDDALFTEIPNIMEYVTIAIIFPKQPNV